MYVCRVQCVSVYVRESVRRDECVQWERGDSEGGHKDEAQRVGGRESYCYTLCWWCQRTGVLVAVMAAMVVCVRKRVSECVCE